MCSPSTCNGPPAPALQALRCPRPSLGRTPILGARPPSPPWALPTWTARQASRARTAAPWISRRSAGTGGGAPRPPHLCRVCAGPAAPRGARAGVGGVWVWVWVPSLLPLPTSAVPPRRVVLLLLLLHKGNGRRAGRQGCEAEEGLFLTSERQGEHAHDFTPHHTAPRRAAGQRGVPAVHGRLVGRRDQGRVGGAQGRPAVSAPPIHTHRVWRVCVCVVGGRGGGGGRVCGVWC